ncbi:hypothetical protein KKG61_03115 [bacterium]|nr:hypothetical protein [bacterium]MBU1599087.1 hypothetical protein [bacterium]MBU2462409.1 hypothetical protein [bacterium]
MKDEEWERAYEESVLYSPTQEDEERHIEGLIRWLSKFPLEKRLRIGYQHTLATLTLMRLKPKI